MELPVWRSGSIMWQPRGMKVRVRFIPFGDWSACTWSRWKAAKSQGYKQQIWLTFSSHAFGSRIKDKIFSIIIQQQFYKWLFLTFFALSQFNISHCSCRVEPASECWCQQPREQHNSEKLKFVKWLQGWLQLQPWNWNHLCIAKDAAGF